MERLDCHGQFPHRLPGDRIDVRERLVISTQVRAGAATSAPLVRANEILLYLLFASAFVLGGSSGDASLRIFLICVAASASLSVALAAGAWGAVRKLPILLRIALFLIPLVPLLQLIPLPPGLWDALPGREVPKAVFALVGVEGQSHPLSLTPAATWLALLMLLPPYAAFFAASLLDDRGRQRCVGLFLALVVLSVLVGVIQVGSAGGALNFYNSAHRGNLIGFFANRNHEGVVLAITAVFSIAFVNARAPSRQSAIAWSAVLTITLLAAVIGTISRAALGLMLLGLFASISLYLVGGQGKRRLWLLATSAVVLAAMIYFFSFSTVVANALARFNDVAENGRSEIWHNSWPLVGQYFPWGSGLGSFVSAYAAREPLDQVSIYYVNSPHDEYLGLLIETGIPGILVLALFAAALVVRGIGLVRDPASGGTYAIPAGLSIGLIALHSIVDYPLRTPTGIVLFAILLVLFYSGPSGRKRVRVRANDVGAEG